MRPSLVLPALWLTSSVLSACGVVAPCGRTRSVSTQGLLQVTPVSGFDAAALASVPSMLQFDADPLYDSNLRDRTAAFEDLWRVLVEGGTLPSNQGLALTLHGRNPARLESLTRLVLVLPTPLRTGSQYPVSNAFPVPIGTTNPDVFGTRYLGREPLTQSGVAALAMFFGRREFAEGNPLADEIPEFIAATASGTVRAERTARRELRLQLDVLLTDAAGRQLRLHGDLFTSGNVTNNSCTS